MSDPVDPPFLSAQHRHMLEVESAIAPDIIAARGYCTVTAEEARRYGFEGDQARAGLIMPVHTTDGKVAGYVLRPDNPRLRISKKAKKDPLTGDRKQEVIKYEWPAKTEPRVDCPPPCFPHLKDPTISLWITEGQKKGDALASWQQCAIDFPNGVWGWKSEQVGILADLDYIVWTDRPVYIVFDSDVITKPAVAKALSRLMTVLSRRGARVSPVPLPQGDEKIGIDDFKAKGGTLEQLMTFVALGKSLPLKTDGRLPTETESAEYLEALARLGYRFRMNAIDDTIEVNGKPITDPLRALIRTRMRDAGYKKVSEVEDAYTAWAYKNQYHPVKDWLNGLKWDGGAHIAALASYFKDDHEGIFKEFYPDEIYSYNGYYIFYCWLRRWLIGAVAKVLDARQNVMLVLDGPQGCGKSHFVSWLGSVLPEFFIEAPINPDDKDSWLRLISKFVWEAGELGASLRRSDREALKNFITTRIVTLRKAYGKYDTIKPAMASLIGTINNEAGFLTDPTGNRRFLICRLVQINWQYTADVDPRQVWAEAVALYRQQEPWTLTPEEVELRDRINLTHYTLENPLEELLWQHFAFDPKLETWTPAMEIVTRLELLGLHGHQGQHLKDLSIAMKKIGAKKGRPSMPGRPVCYKGVYKK